MARPKGTLVWPEIPLDRLWEWYWGDLLSPEEIANLWGREVGPARYNGRLKDKPSPRWVTDLMAKLKIPQRSASDRARLWQMRRTVNPGRYKLSYTSGAPTYLHREIYEQHYGVRLKPREEVDHLDHVTQNNHPLNLGVLSKSDHTRRHVRSRVGHNKPSRPSRIPIFEVYMRMAEDVAARSHHPTVKIGCVITSFDLRRVLSVGYNGNASGLEDSPDCTDPGESQTIHAESNALIYAGEHGTDRVMFVTVSPCLLCTKLLVNAGVKYLYYRQEYREPHPIKVARYLGVMVCKYDKWAKTEWRMDNAEG